MVQYTKRGNYYLPKKKTEVVKKEVVKKKVTESTIAERQKKVNDVYREELLYPKQSFSFSVDIPLSINHMYVRTRYGGQRLSKEAEKYVLNTRANILAVMEDNNFKKISNASWYYLDIIVYMPDKRIRDASNMLKLLLDALETVLFVNDYYVLPNIKSVELDKGNPRLECVFRPQKEKDRKAM